MCNLKNFIDCRNKKKMATDVEESDTEDHERPVPPKRKCIKVVDRGQENAEQMVN